LLSPLRGERFPLSSYPWADAQGYVLPSLRDYETGQFPLSLALQATVPNSPIKADVVQNAT
jgi:hypothetical protein